jgi:hypothetical protein
MCLDPSCTYCAPQVLIHPATLTLHPGEVLHETLTLVPSAPGWLRVTGVSWVTDGVVPGWAMFDIRGRHRKKPKGDRWVACLPTGLFDLSCCMWRTCPVCYVMPHNMLASIHQALQQLLVLMGWNIPCCQLFFLCSLSTAAPAAAAVPCPALPRPDLT